MDNIKIEVPTSWNDINLEKFEKLQKVNQNDNDADLQIVSICCGMDIEKVGQLSIPTFSKIVEKLNFITTPPQPCKPAKRIKINDKILVATLSHSEMTAAQFFDYQNIIKSDIDKKMARICACIFIPDGHTYNDGYDIDEFVDFINENITVVEALSYANFFMIVFQAFADSILKYSLKQIKKMKNMTEESIMKVTQPILKLQHLIKNGGYSV